MANVGKERETRVGGAHRGRGTSFNPPNRFEKRSLHVLGEYLDQVAVERHDLPDGRQVTTEVFRDTARTVINRVDSPDVDFDWTVNPYRGCEHGCVYCYARPTHEALSLSCGLDFETKILAKVDAPQLLRRELAAPGWRGDPIVMSGVTDCYQPIESRLLITRGYLEMMAEARQSVTLVTKSRLVLRDLDVLSEMAKRGTAAVAISVTTLDNALASKMEPRAASPRDRLWTIQRLASARIPVTAMVAPVIPAVNDREVPAILKAVANAGASTAAYVLLRLPYQIKDLFEQWLNRHMPERRARVQRLMRQTRGGKLYDATWGTRMTGQGPYAEQIRQLFRVYADRYGLNRRLPPLNIGAFRRPAHSTQLTLFEVD